MLSVVYYVLPALFRTDHATWNLLPELDGMAEMACKFEVGFFGPVFQFVRGSSAAIATIKKAPKTKGAKCKQSESKSEVQRSI